MISTSGSQLLPGDAVRSLREKLIPMCTILTPNIPEATLLLRDADIQYKSPSNLAELKEIARLVQQLGPQTVLLKGGHIPLTKDYEKASTDPEKQITIDIFYDGREHTVIESRYQRSKNTHGTGCSLASAIAANLALNPAQPLSQSVRSAIRYVGTGIATSSPLGHGSGPINHFHNLRTLPFSSGHFIEYLLDRPDVSPLWHRYTHHPFATAMATNTLPLPHFKSYLTQDYLYLVHFARANALAAYKSTDMAAVAASAQIVLHIQTEMELHLSYCAEFGLSRQEIEATKESLATTAYSRYVLDIGQSQDWLALQMSLAPCLLGYGVAAERLHRDDDGTSVREGNPYWRWIENYVAADYTEAVRKGRGKFFLVRFSSRPNPCVCVCVCICQATHNSPYTKVPPNNPSTHVPPRVNHQSPQPTANNIFPTPPVLPCLSLN